MKARLLELLTDEERLNIPVVDLHRFDKDIRDLTAGQLHDLYDLIKNTNQQYCLMCIGTKAGLAWAELLYRCKEKLY